MAYDTDLADRIRELVAAERGVEEKRCSGAGIPDQRQHVGSRQRQRRSDGPRPAGRDRQAGGPRPRRADGDGRPRDPGLGARLRRRCQDQTPATGLGQPGGRLRQEPARRSDAADDDPDRHLGLVLRPLDRRAVSRRAAGVQAPGPLRRRVRHRRAQRQLLPLAARRHLRRLAPTAARRVHHVGQGAPRADPLPSAAFAGAVDRAVRAVLDGARRPARGATGSAASRAGARRRAARALPCPYAAMDSGGDGTASSVLGRPRRVRHPRTAPAPRTW